VVYTEADTLLAGVQIPFLQKAQVGLPIILT
jgi:hypothetical protein